VLKTIAKTVASAKAAQQHQTPPPAPPTTTSTTFTMEHNIPSMCTTP